MIRRPFSKMLLACLCCGLFSVQAAADWPSWRGPADLGSIEQGEYPKSLGKDHLVWSSPLPGKGCSTPIIHDEVIYVTAPSDGKDALLAIDANGKRKWTTTFGPEVAGKHRNGSGSNASPVTDGSAVFVYFKSGTLAAVEFDGEIRWQTNLVQRFGKDTLYWDHGTSPVVTQDFVVMARMHAGESWIAAFDKKTGEMAWKTPRNYETPVEGDHGYTSPMVIEYEGKETILLWGAQHLTMHSPADGKVFWSCGNFNPEDSKLWPAIAMPVIVKDVAVICFGRNDRGIPRMFGVRLKGKGDVTDSAHLWQRDDVSSFVPSPLAYRGLVYLVRDRGEVECLDAATGETLWSDRFPKARANFYASPLIAGDRLFAAREDGALFVANVGDGKFELLSEDSAGQPVIGSPIPMSDKILVRGENALLCFGKQAN